MGGAVAWLDGLATMRGDDLLRLKAIVALSDRPDQPVVLHGVQHLFHPPVLLPEWPSQDRRTRMVFITRDLPQEAIEATLAAFEDAVAEAADPSLDREPGADNAIFENAAAAVGDVALLDKALEHIGDRFGADFRLGRHVLDEIVAKAAPGHKDRLDAAGLRDRGERHRPSA